MRIVRAVQIMQNENDMNNEDRADNAKHAISKITRIIQRVRCLETRHLLQIGQHPHQTARHLHEQVLVTTKGPTLGTGHNVLIMIMVLQHGTLKQDAMLYK